MRVWLIKTGENLPTDGEGVRLLRMGILAQQLVDSGHDVTFWAATFRHFQKTHRFREDKVIELSDNYRLRLIHTAGYRKNRSIARVRDHAEWARKFSEQAGTLDPPSVILCSMPIPSLCLAATRYGREHGVPVVLDIRDLWPDVFLESLPRGASWLARPILWPMARTTRTACSMATAILGITPSYVQWGLDNAGREATSLDRAFPMGYLSGEPQAEAVEAAHRFWAAQGLASGSGVFIACFFGLLGPYFEIEPILEAARILQGDQRKFRFVICGAGDDLERYRRMSADLPNVLFPGYVDFTAIWTLMRMAQVGLAPYRSIGNFLRNLPNKPIEYMSGGLPIVSSLQGILADLLREHHCGLTYANGNVDQLVECLTRLYDDEPLRAEMARNARELFEERYVAERIYADMVRHLERVVHNSS